MGDLVRTAIAQAWQIEAAVRALARQSAGGIRNAYPEPAKLGVDRWLAMLGGHALERGAVCVVSVGTAMTIDGVDADGRHLGGVIVPGPDLMVGSLLKNTSDIAQRARRAMRAMNCSPTTPSARFSKARCRRSRRWSSGGG